MPTIGSNKNPIRLGDPSIVRIASNVYSGSNKENYDSNYDRIFGKKKDTKLQGSESEDTKDS